MGDPRKNRKKFQTPMHPWQSARIESEKEIVKKYGIKRKNEIWKMDSQLKSFLKRAKTVIALRTEQSEIEKKQLLDRLSKLGLLKEGDARVENVLNLTLKDVMERRLQTVLVKKQIAQSMLQSRQFITHGIVAVGTRKVTSPSYLVAVSEEPNIRLLKAINLNAEPTKKEGPAQAEAKAE
jgi:small subunit ribosomal protein S4